MVVDKEIIAKICSLIRGIEREGYLSSWLVGGCQATQGAVTTAIRKEGLLLCCCTCRLAFWARQSGLQLHHHIFCAGAVQHSGWRGPFWASLLGLLAKVVFLCFFAEEEIGSDGNR